MAFDVWVHGWCYFANMCQHQGFLSQGKAKLYHIVEGPAKWPLYWNKILLHSFWTDLYQKVGSTESSKITFKINTAHNLSPFGLVLPPATYHNQRQGQWKPSRHQRSKHLDPKLWLTNISCRQKLVLCELTNIKTFTPPIKLVTHQYLLSSKSCTQWKSLRLIHLAKTNFPTTILANFVLKMILIRRWDYLQSEDKMRESKSGKKCRTIII